MRQLFYLRDAIAMPVTNVLTKFLLSILTVLSVMALKIRVSESFGNNARIYNEETEISAPIFDF
jgi:hypothetical protein